MPRLRTRGSSRFRSTSPIRGTEWVSAATGGIQTFPGVSAVSANYIVLPSVARQYTNPTLVRTRGQLVLNSLGSAGVSADCYGAAALIAWSDRDDTIPATPPRPVGDPDLDWLWHNYFYMTGGQTLASGYQQRDIMIDSKAMRKLGADQGVLLCIQVLSTTSAVGGFGIRCLIKE